MCGGHGIHHIFGLITADEAQTRDVSHYSSEHGDLYTSVEQQVKLMYARGEIGAEAYHHLLDMARSDGLKPGDLTAFQARQASIPFPPTVQRGHRPSSSAHSKQLQERKNQLQAACAETEESIQRLRLEAAQLYQRAESAEISLKGTSPNSEDFHALSRVREEALAHARSIDERIDHIEERLSHLRSQLDELAA